jgi:hypothetical protein
MAYPQNMGLTVFQGAFAVKYLELLTEVKYIADAYFVGYFGYRLFRGYEQMLGFFHPYPHKVVHGRDTHDFSENIVKPCFRKEHQIGQGLTGYLFTHVDRHIVKDGGNLL